MYRMHHPENTSRPVIELDNIHVYVSSIRGDQPPQPRNSPRRIKVEQRAGGGDWVEVGEIQHFADCRVEYVPKPQPPATAAAP